MEALEACTLHPAQFLKVEHKKGTLAFGSDADLVLLDDTLQLHATFIAGQMVHGKSPIATNISQQIAAGFCR